LSYRPPKFNFQPAHDVFALVYCQSQTYRKVDNRRIQFATGALGAIVALALILFPDWHGVYPSHPEFIYEIGFAWIGSPPPPPPIGFASMRVEHDGSGFIWAGTIILVTIAACWFLDENTT
jgi:hypothetical protein